MRHKNKLAFILVLCCLAVVPMLRSSTNFTSAWDEHAHLSYVQYTYNFKWPAPGYPMNTWGREAFACHPHQIYGPMAVAACGEFGPGSEYPTGGANTADGWPPLAYTAIANLSRPFFLFTDDALHAVRLGTALLWSFGMLCLFGLAKQRGVRKLQSLSAILAITALPGIGYFSSFVSPYAALPILTAYAIWTYDWLVEKLSQGNLFDPRSLMKTAAALGFPAVAILAVPHSISVVVAISIGLGLNLLRNIFPLKTLRLEPRSLLLGISALLFTPAAYATNRFYNSIRAWRSIDYPTDTVPDVTDVVATGHDSNWFAQARSRTWDFFPNAINSALPVPEFFGFAATLLTLFVIAVVAARALTLMKSNDHGFFEIGILLASPISALVYYYSLSFEAPPRYGLPLALLGFCLIIVRKLPNRAIVAIVALSATLNVVAVQSDPIYIEQPCWQVGDSGYLELCESS